MQWILLNIGLEYVDAVFQVIKDSDFSRYTITGVKTFAVLLFLINILKKYQEGVVDRDGYTWGLSPGELVKNFTIVLLVIFSSQILGFFDAVLTVLMRFFILLSRIACAYSFHAPFYKFHIYLIQIFPLHLIIFLH